MNDYYLLAVLIVLVVFQILKRFPTPIQPYCLIISKVLAIYAKRLIRKK